jgi:hypothetical protein
MKLFSQYDRFELEQDILKVWEVTDLIEELVRQHLDRPQGPMGEDEMANKLDAIKHVTDLRLQRLWDGFEVMLKNGGFANKFAVVPDVDFPINVKKKGSKKND